MDHTPSLSHLTFAIVGQSRSELQQWFTSNLVDRMLAENHVQLPEANGEALMVLNLVTDEDPRAFRRQSQSIYVASIIVAGKPLSSHVLKDAYPLLVKSLSNLVIYVVKTDDAVEVYFVTLEQGHEKVSSRGLSDEAFFAEVYGRLKPRATSTLVIDNLFVLDLPESLWNGTSVTEQMYQAGKALDALKLLPSLVPLEDILTERELRHVWRLFRIGGLSYGNVSARHDANYFWMSASGVDKSNLRQVGEHVHLVQGYDSEKNAIVVSVPPHVKRPNRVSVDAIEHHMIYSENPDVGAVVHAHCWLQPDAPLSPDYTIAVTEEAYPCGTRELARATASVIHQAPDPTRTIIGQKNHGLVITGRNLPDIFDRIDSDDIPITVQIPMM